MKTNLRIWVLVAALLFFLVSLCERGEAEEKLAPKDAGILATATVAHCFDGDTVKLTDRRMVRIAGIDCPELAQQGRKEQFYARSALQELRTLIHDQKLTLIEVSVKPKDQHGHILCDLLLQDGTSVAETMIRKGAAFFAPHKDLLPQFQEKLLTLQREAITNRAGLWEVLLDEPVAKQNFIGNKDSLRFVTASCPQAQTIKPRNRVYFGTLMDAFLAGYAPERICLFWPASTALHR